MRKIYKTRYLAFHKKIDSFVFKSFVKENKSLDEILEGFTLFKKQFKGKINPMLFSDAYCKDYIVDFYNRLQKNKEEKSNGFRKSASIVEAILFRFVANKKNVAFLPQENIAKAVGCSQKTVSTKIKKLVEEGFLIIRKKYHFREHKATEYYMGPKAIEIYKLLCEKTEKTFEKAKRIMYNITKGIKVTWSQFLEEKRREISLNIIEHYKRSQKALSWDVLLEEVERIVGGFSYRYSPEETNWYF